MNDSASRHEDEFTARLLACDEALAAGEPAPLPATPDASPEVRARLERNVECLRLLQQLRPQPTTLAAGEPATPPGSGSAPIEPGEPVLTMLARFQIRGELGRGGFGIVYLAHDPQLHRDVALKVPRSDLLDSPEMRERFVAEARAAARLEHPNIVPVHDAEVLGPVAYIAYAYCPGPTLADWLKDRGAPLPPREAAALVLSLARAVHHAHQRGVVHRDLKPANILLSRIEDGGSRIEGTPSSILDPLRSSVPKITDFGLAKLLDAEPGPTRTRVILGTASYMAPEQAEGGSRSAGPAADVYALGAILYETLTGRPPFRGQNDLQTLRQVLEQEPQPLRQINTAVDAGLEAICLKALEKPLSRRYHSAAELAGELESWLSGNTPQANRWLPRLRRVVRRRALACALGLVAVLVPLVLALSVYFSDPDRQWARTEQRLERGGALVLSEGGLPAWARWRTGNGEGQLRTARDGSVTLSIEETYERGFMELVPRVQVPSYRFSARVRHNRKGNERGYVGLAFAHLSYPTQEGTEHGFLTLEFNDLLVEPRGNTRPHNCLTLGVRRYRDPRPPRDICDHREVLCQVPFKPAAAPLASEPWRFLAVEVTPSEVRIFWENEEVPVERRPRARIDESVRRLLATSQPPEGVALKYDPAGGLGLIVIQASASYRDIVLQPLDDNP